MLFNCCLMGFTGILYINMVIQWGIAHWLFYMAMEMAHLIYVDVSMKKMVIFHSYEQNDQRV